MKLAFRETMLILTLALALTLDISGALHVYGLGFVMGQRYALLVSLLLVICAAAWLVCSVWAYGRSEPPISAKWGRYLAGAALLMWAATCYNGIGLLAKALTWPWLIWASVGLLVFAWALLRPISSSALALWAALLGSAARIMAFGDLAILPRNGDMLPLVEAALANLLQGDNPYQIYQMPWEVPLTYLPATWLAYLPAFLLGLDIRITNILAELSIGGALFWLFRSLKEQPLRQKDAGLALAVWACIFLQPSSLNWSLSTTAPVFWACLVLGLVLLLSERHWRAALVLGIAAAASPLSVIVIPFVALFWLRRFGWYRTAALLLGFASCFGVLVAPFLLWSPESFLFGVWRWFNDNSLYPRLRWEMDHTWARMPGLSGIFWRRGLEYLLKPIQISMMFGLVIWFVRHGALERLLAPTIVAAYILFTVFNPVVWPYFYVPALVMALVALTALERREAPVGPVGDS